MGEQQQAVILRKQRKIQVDNKKIVIAEKPRDELLL